jgi:hypothetical protein
VQIQIKAVSIGASFLNDQRLSALFWLDLAEQRFALIIVILQNKSQL